jgi:hypothetical protein
LIRNEIGRTCDLSATDKKTKPSTALLILVMLAVLAGTANRSSAQPSTPLQLVYRVSHSKVGYVGSYSCAVSPLGNGMTQISSREQIDVALLGIPLYWMDAVGTERWQGNRLISFDATTEKTTGRVEVRGEARGSDFVITSPQGTLTAAGSVHPAEPCAPDFLQSTTILRPDTGGIEEVRISGGAPTSVVIDGTSIPVHKYILDGRTRYTAWLDARNLPVMFAIEDNAGEATFTLTRCAPCKVAAYRLGMR